MTKLTPWLGCGQAIGSPDPSDLIKKLDAQATTLPPILARQKLVQTVTNARHRDNIYEVIVDNDDLAHLLSAGKPVDGLNIQVRFPTACLDRPNIKFGGSEIEIKRANGSNILSKFIETNDILTLTYDAVGQCWRCTPTRRKWIYRLNEKMEIETIGRRRMYVITDPVAAGTAVECRIEWRGAGDLDQIWVMTRSWVQSVVAPTASKHVTIFTSVGDSGKIALMPYKKNYQVFPTGGLTALVYCET